MLTSLKNERVKLTRALQTRAKTRRKENKIALEGLRLIRDALQAGYTPHFALYQPDKADPSLLDQLQATSAPLLPVSPEVMRHISQTQQPQGIVAVFPLPTPTIPQPLHHLLILDSIRDPGNLGTILRTAAAAGIEAVLLSPTCADPYNPKILRSGMGAHFRLPVLPASWDAIANHCRPLTVYLADAHGQTRYDLVDWTGDWAIIIGSEAHGPSIQTTHLAHARIYIPLAAGTESLNAAVAAGIILFEARRQRQ